MALKDWKKFEAEFPELYIWHNESKEINIGIDDNRETQASNKKYLFNIFLDNNDGGKILKSFKTKLQALKHAKAYMRNN